MFFSNEIVFRGHPDKVADQISDYLLDKYISIDPYSRCGIEVVGGKNKIFVTGEVTSRANVNVERAVKCVLNQVGYRDDYEIIDNIGKQSPDISQGVDVGGAGDQGMMFGYACRDTDAYVPLAMNILQTFAIYYDFLRQSDKRFLPDGKAQITGCYDESGKLRYIKDFVISYQNTEEDRKTTDEILIDYCRTLCHQHYIAIENFHINPTGKFLIGGFDGDAGLTGRKTVVDTYQGFAPSGGGALSGKDGTKVDRSGAYKARQLAIRFLDEHPEYNWAQVQLSYAIGIAQPMAIYITTDKGAVNGDFKEWYAECEPRAIMREFGLGKVDLKSESKYTISDPNKPAFCRSGHKQIKFYDTAKYGHFGMVGLPWH